MRIKQTNNKLQPHFKNLLNNKVRKNMTKLLKSCHHRLYHCIPNARFVAKGDTLRIFLEYAVVTWAIPSL